MPRCMMNTVRGYRDGKYWGCEADSQNVMKTRSGRVISTIPKQRSNVRPAAIASSSSGTNLTEKQKERKNSGDGDTKPMSCLSFVTRFELIKHGVPLNFTSDLACSDDWNNDIFYGISPNDPLRSDVLFTDSDSSPCKNDPQAMDLSHLRIKPEKKILSGNGIKKEPTTRINLVKHCTGSSEISEGTRQGTVKVGKRLIKNGSNYFYIAAPQAVPTAATMSSLLKPPASKLNTDQLNKLSVAERHPVLLQCISTRDDAKTNAASSLLTLANSGNTGGEPKTTDANNNLTVTNTATTSNLKTAAPTTTHLIMYTTPSNFSPKKLKPAVDTESLKAGDILDDPCLKGELTEPSTEESDDSSSVTSESSMDETFIQRASETDATFRQDLSRFHMESHGYGVDVGGNQIHRCMICNKVFTVFAAFRTHVNTHVRPKNRCGVCGKIFSRSWLLKGHLRTHTGERPYNCRYAGCDKRFADKSNLRSHMLIHTTKEKTYVCAKCSRAFAQKRYLHKHKLEVCKI